MTPEPTIHTGTVRAALVTCALYLAARYGLPSEVASAVAELVAALGAVAVAYYLRRGVAKSGPALLLTFAMLSGCCSHQPSKPLANSYRRWLNGPGLAWVESAKKDPRLDQSDALDRQARWDVASALVSAYESEVDE